MSEINFSKALEVLIDGKHVTRKEWDDIRTYGLIQDNILHIHKAGEGKETTRPWILSDADIIADDWIVL